VSAYALHESCGTRGEDVGDVLAVADGFEFPSYPSGCTYGEETAPVEERQRFSADGARGIADWWLAFGVIVFVVSVETLGIDSLAEFGGQIKKAVKRVVFVVVPLELCFGIFYGGPTIW
jgi:hypothetical protein